MHLFEPVRHLLERLTKPLVERRLQFFIDGRAHLIEFLRILVAQHIEALLHRQPNRLEPLLVRFRELNEPIAELLHLFDLRSGHPG